MTVKLNIEFGGMLASVILYGDCLFNDILLHIIYNDMPFLEPRVTTTGRVGHVRLWFHWKAETEDYQGRYYNQ